MRTVVESQQQAQKEDDDEISTTTDYDDDDLSDDTISSSIDYKELHIAPMLHVSTMEFRALLRILSKRLILWTEMIVDETLVNIPATNLLEHLASVSLLPDPTTRTTKEVDGGGRMICQIGGNSPELCSQATTIITNFSRYYSEINLNVDCPSARVSGTREFGACLMKKAQLTKEILESMSKSAAAAAAAASAATDTATTGSTSSTTTSTSTTTTIPPPPKISIKCRIGIDEWDDIEFITTFIETLRPVCKRFYLHARKCVLKGFQMNARANRTIPPLNFPRVYELCRRFPDCQFWLNGGIKTLKQAKQIVYGGAGLDDDGEDVDGKDLESQLPTTTTTSSSSSSTSSSSSSNCINGQHHHEVPCKLCNLPYGSCCTPPLGGPGSVPKNLRGCMMGRAAMDHPSQFWNVDRYFYGCDDNPCHNRREVLEKYCQFLEQIYPKRCCDDDDDRITHQYPAPATTPYRNHCSICQDIYGPSSTCSSSNESEKEKEEQQQSTLTFTTTTAIPLSTPPPPPPPSSLPPTNTTNKSNRKKKKKKKPKIASRIIGRSLKPIVGIFNGIPYSRAFRRCLDDLGQDLNVRNCGPGYILRLAIKRTIPDKILDQPFEEEEEEEEDWGGCC